MNEYLRIDDALDGAVRALEAQSDSPRLDAELLLARALDVPRSYLFAHPDDTMDPAAVERFNDVIAQRTDGVPMAYITGEKEFWSMSLIVSRATLVPRPDTETLVEQALLRIPRRIEMDILDLGTGSGAIALAIARDRPASNIVATDISEDAIAVASENARQQTIPNVEFLAGSWTDPVRNREFDLIVSNPPYVASADPHLAALQHEPRLALDAGPDGLDAIRQIAATADSILKPGGALLLEHGAEQAAAVGDILRKNGWTDIQTAKDLAGITRVTIATRRDR